MQKRNPEMCQGVESLEMEATWDFRPYFAEEGKATPPIRPHLKTHEP